MLRLNDQELSDLIAKLEAERVPDPKNDQEFLNLILKVDDELYEEGFLDPKSRVWELYIRVMTKLGHASVSMCGPEQRRFHETLKKTLYRPEDLAAGGLHGGAFMFRGIATTIEVVS